MQARYDLVFLGIYSWSSLERTGFASRDGQLLRALIRRQRIGRVAFINPYYLPRSAASLAKQLLLNCAAPPLFNPFLGRRRHPGIAGLSILNPLLRPGGTLIRQLFRLLEPRNRTIVWLNNAAEHGFHRHFPRAVPVFDTVDNWLEIGRIPENRQLNPWYDPRAMEAGYEAVARGETGIISNGPVMSRFYRQRGACESRILELPNGVNPRIFDPDDPRLAKVPADLAPLPRPVAGYVGRFEYRVDVDLLRELSRELPGLSFVMIGPREKIDCFRAPNVHWLGHRPYRDIPRYIKHFDVCLLPHLRNGLTRHMSPMKVFEYLAMGKPVVTTAVGGLEGLEEHCLVAEDRAGFGRLLRRAAGLGEDGSHGAGPGEPSRSMVDRAALERTEEARARKFRTEHSWDRKAVRILDWIEALAGEPRR